MAATPPPILGCCSPLPTPSSFNFRADCSGGRRMVSALNVSGKSQGPIVTKLKSSVPIRKVPGDYGLPVIGPWRDRLAYFYFEGRDEFFKSRVRKYGSTVIRVNMPPGPCVAKDPRVVALLDAVSFPVLFDTSLVEKRDLFTGTYMPSTEMTGGYRVLSYLDPSEPHHAPLKKVLFYLLASRRHEIIPQFRSTFGSLFDSLEDELAAKGKADFGALNDLAVFDYLSRALFGRDPAESKLGRDAPKLISKWVLFQLGFLYAPFFSNPIN